MPKRKQKMGADAAGNEGNSLLERAQLRSDHQSPAPDSPDRRKKSDDDGDFKGGQSNQAYFGHGQLGEKDVEGKTHNAPSKED